MNTATTHKKEEIWSFLKEVTDPEIPVLNVAEIGIVRDILIEKNRIIIKITPTYSGCPAMSAIEQDIYQKMLDEGVENVDVKKDFSEPWTTNWMTDEASQKLKDYGIAPPGKSFDEDVLTNAKIIPCPYCNSFDTELQSKFGSTACKALYYCHHCEEPFEHFKCI